jgi:uncharacterized SAM-binding protein YcdF (DUF218 family)
MFFILSKTLGFFASPINLTLIIGAAGVGLCASGRRRSGCALGGGALLILLLLGFSPLPLFLLHPLEARFPQLPADAPAPDGIIVLGGAMDEHSSALHGQAVINDAAERLTEALRLRRLYPQARLVFTGGSASLRGSAHTEAEYVEKFWTALGLDPKGVVYESRSRNTFENAVFTRDLVRPAPGARWLLVTSAAHMPRAVGLFRKAGFPVVADPVDYRTAGESLWALNLHAPDHFTLAEIATHEWIGLVAYWATGKTDALFPAP